MMGSVLGVLSDLVPKRLVIAFSGFRVLKHVGEDLGNHSEWNVGSVQRRCLRHQLFRKCGRSPCQNFAVPPGE